jgi:hypothetical protein
MPQTANEIANAMVERTSAFVDLPAFTPESTPERTSVLGEPVEFGWDDNSIIA